MILKNKLIVNYEKEMVNIKCVLFPLMKLTHLTNSCFGLRLECPFDTAVQLAAYNLQGKQFLCWLKNKA